MGSEILQYVNCDNINLVARVSNRSTARAGDHIKMAVEAARVHIFDKDTEKCLIH